MGPKSRVFSRYRLRLVTLLVLLIVAVPIFVTNLRHEEVSLEAGTPPVWPPPNPSYGWPLIWYECEFKPRTTIGGVVVAVGRMNPEIVQWNWPSLAANLAFWLVMLAVAGVTCEWLLRRYFPRFSFRPRVVTTIVLIVVAAPIVLANLSHNDFKWTGQNPARHPMYGWPLIWRWRNIQLWYGATTELDENYSTARLAGNLALWLVMLGAAGGTCEWLMRRYRPRLRFSLRTMLGAVGLAAVLCAWYASLRHLANLQDPIISTYADSNRTGVYLHLERWGPKWVDLVGGDRFRRHIVGADVSELGTRQESDEELLKQLERLPRLRYLDLREAVATSEMAGALANMRQLRILRVGNGAWGGYYLSSDCLEAIGQLSKLEELYLSGTTDGSLAHLAGLTKLKSLSVLIEWQDDDADWDDEEQEPNDGEQETDAIETNGAMKIEDEQEADEPESGRGIPLFEYLPALPRLEAIDLRGDTIVNDEDLRRLTILPRLKSLNLSDVDVSDAGLANLASLRSLEELAIGGNLATEERLQSLCALERLKALHIVRYLAVTDARLAELPNLESLQEREIAGDSMPWTGIELLGAFKQLKAQRIQRHGSYDNSNRLTTLALDHGDQIFVLESEVDGLRRALDALRQSKPGIVIDSDPKWFDRRRGEKRQESLFLLAPVR